MTTSTAEVKTVTSFSNAAKFYVGLAVALVAALGTMSQGHLTVSNFAQILVLALTLIAGYTAPYSPKWWKSAKAYAVTAGAVLSAVIPLLVQYGDTGEWRNLTQAEWIVVVLAAIKAVAMIVTTNTKPLKIATTGGNSVADITTGLPPTAALTGPATSEANYKPQHQSELNFYTSTGPTAGVVLHPSDIAGPPTSDAVQ